MMLFMYYSCIIPMSLKLSHVFVPFPSSPHGPWPIGSRPLALSCSPKMHLDGTSDGTPAVQRESNRWLEALETLVVEVEEALVEALVEVN